MTPLYGIMASQITGKSSAFESIATATGTGSSGTITFSSIPSTYQHLQIRAIARSTEAATGFAYLQLQANGITTTDYAIHRLRADGTTVTSEGFASQTVSELGNVVRNNETAGNHGVTIIDILNYASTTKNKTFRSITGWDANGSGRIMLLSGLLVNTSAISSITLTVSGGNFTTSSQFALYGIKGV